MTANETVAQSPTPRRLITGLIVAGVAGVLAAGLLLRPGEQPAVDNALVESAYPLVAGQVQNFLLDPNPKHAPEIAFVDADRAALTLEDFHGQWVLLNLWATWCGPCKREMPSLDRLQAALGGEGFLVLALSQDRTGMDDVQAFYEEFEITRIALFLDDTAKSQFQFGLTGLPATMLLDPNGYVVGRMPGPAEWDSPEALALFRHFMAGTEAAGRPAG